MTYGSKNGTKGKEMRHYLEGFIVYVVLFIVAVTLVTIKVQVFGPSSGHVRDCSTRAGC